MYYKQPHIAKIRANLICSVLRNYSSLYFQNFYSTVKWLTGEKQSSRRPPSG